MRNLRIQAFTRSDWSGFQLLQERRWWGWKTIDQEAVPAHVRICLATCGDAGGWQSKFRDLPAWSKKKEPVPLAAKLYLAFGLVAMSAPLYAAWFGG